jgi:hypothetical protein
MNQPAESPRCRDNPTAVCAPPVSASQAFFHMLRPPAPIPPTDRPDAHARSPRLSNQPNRS